jgi:hypothetical protein
LNSEHDLWLKYLEMIQAVITRVADGSATVKNYCVTLATAVCGLAITVGKPNLIILGLLPIFGTALLDAQYLQVERGYRKLYNSIREAEWTGRPTFDLESGYRAKVSLIDALHSWSILGFYLPLALGVVLVAQLAGGLK